MQRDSTIELYRVLLMLGICLLHALTVGEHNRPWLANILCSCVVGFVFISGWFGVKFSWRKLVRLYGIGAYATLVVFAGLMCGDPDMNLSCALCSAYGLLIKGFWFLHAYALMMVLAPLVNTAFDHGGRTAVVAVAPLVFAVWGWGFGLTLPIVGDKLPRTPGLEAYGGVTLLAIYAAARFCRLHEIDQRIRSKWFVVWLPVLLALTGCGLGDYNSPFAFGLAFVGVALCRRLRLSAWFGRFVVAIAPSMFSVYLIHTNAVGFSLIRHVETSLFGICGSLSLVLAASLCFFCAVALDMPRRLALLLVKKWFRQEAFD